MKKEIQNTKLKVFIQDARLLSEEEQANLPREKREAAANKPGLWIEVACPEGACSVEGDKITLPAGGVIPKESKGIWLSLFCPENQCAVEQSVDLP
jgi:hypothetical protein